MQVNPERQNDMMDARWRYFHHSVSMAPGPQNTADPCARCFCRWLLHGPEEAHGSSECILPLASHQPTMSPVTPCPGSQKRLWFV